MPVISLCSDKQDLPLTVNKTHTSGAASSPRVSYRDGKQHSA